MDTIGKSDPDGITGIYWEYSAIKNEDGVTEYMCQNKFLPYYGTELSEVIETCKEEEKRVTHIIKDYARISKELAEMKKMIAKMKDVMEFVSKNG